MWRAKIFLLLSWLSCWGLTARAASSAQVAKSGLHYLLSNWTTDDGLPQNSVNSMVQARDGYLWFTTFDGLVRYDGLRFTVFNKANSKGLSDNRLRDIGEFGDGKLWLTTEDDTRLIIYQQGHFTSFSENEGLPGRLRSGVFADENGALIFTTERGHFCFEDGKFTPLAGVPTNLGNIIYRDRAGGLWFAQPDRLECVKKDGTRETYQLPLFISPLGMVDFYQDRLGRFWVADGRHNLRRLQPVTQEWQEYPVVAAGALQFAEDPAGNLWLSHNQIGVFRIDAWAVASGEVQADAVEQFSAPDGLANERLTSITTDREGSTWFGTATNGLSRLLPQSVTVWARKDGLREENAYPVLERRDGSVWVGFWEQTLARYNQESFQTVLDNPAFPFISSLCEDRDGVLWFGNLNGIFHWDERSPPHPFTNQAGFTGRVVVNVIMQDRAGAMWFGTDHGLSRYANGNAQVFTVRDGLPDNDITAWLEDARGRVWVGTKGGFAWWENGRWHSRTIAHGLVSNYVRSLYADDTGVLWIGTYDGGLSRFENDQFTNYNTTNGLFSNGVFCIIESGGWFWMNSNQGIYRVRRQELNDFAAGRVKTVTSLSYNKQDGLLNIEGNGGRQPAGIQTRDGRLWFPTTQGVAVIDPRTTTLNEVQPPVWIEEILVNHADLTLKAGVAELDPGQDDLEIRYTGISLAHPDRVRFRYQMEGLDDDWQEAGARRVAYYPYLPAGDYTFRVIAANRDGVWNTTGATLKVRVLPPFYLRWWFITLCGLALGGIVVGGFRLRVRQLETARLMQEDFARRLLSAHESERFRIATELHDGLGQNLAMIKNNADFGAQTVDDLPNACGYLTEISSQATQAIAEVRSISHNLRPYLLEKLGLTQALRSLLRKWAETAPLAVTVDIPDLEGAFDSVAEISIYRIVQESLNNILKHAAATQVEVTARRLENVVILTIRDNGRGFVLAADDVPRGLGLLGMTERIKLLGGSYQIQTAPGQGTRLTFTLKSRQ